MKKFQIILLTIFIFSFPVTKEGVCAREQDRYVIGNDDVLDVTVWQSQDLSKPVTVESDGTIDYPLLGRLEVVGLTPPQLAKVIQDKLGQGFVKSPQVSVSVKEYNSKKVLVFGEVGKPGLYKLRKEIPVLELLFMVGGASSGGKRMMIIRSPQPPLGGFNSELLESSSGIEVDLISLLSKGDLSQNITIKPGDTIYVSSGTGLRYYVLGQVKKPGPYEWSQDITVLEAIKLADGVTDRGAPNRIKVKKNYKGQTHETKVNMTDIMKGKKKDDVIVKPGDTIIVPESWI